MIILSLFDGCSTGQIALDRANICYERYYSSEINKYSIAVTQYNYPNTIQLGDIKYINYNKLPKIDIIIGGSPCQGFSVGGKRGGFNDKRSMLFFEFVKAIEACNPKYFLFENVCMKQEYKNIISSYLGVLPIYINSSLVSAQFRKRLYWTNIPNISLPNNKHIMLKDIIEFYEVDKNYYIDDYYYGHIDFADYENIKQNINDNTSMIGSLVYGNVQSGRIYSIFGKSVTLKCNGGGYGGKTGLYYINGNVRRLTPVECERLQNIPDNYTMIGVFGNKIKKLSNTQRYRMIGEAFTVDIIVHILKGMLRE